MSVSVHVTMEEALVTIGKLKDRQIPKFRKEAANQLALEFLKMMKFHSPVDTGRMRGSMDIYDHPRGIVIGPTVYYAPFVALGTRFAKAQPFHEWAYEDVMDRAPTILDAVAQRILVGELK